MPVDIESEHTRAGADPWLRLMTMVMKDQYDDEQDRLWRNRIIVLLLDTKLISILSVREPYIFVPKTGKLE